MFWFYLQYKRSSPWRDARDARTRVTGAGVLGVPLAQDHQARTSSDPKNAVTSPLFDQTRLDVYVYIR